jgi:mono/diheme cytochrome c family protein
MHHFTWIPAAALLAGQAFAFETPTGDIARGKTIAETNCATCHAVGPAGDSPYAYATPFRTLPLKYDLDGLAEALAEGIEVGHRGARQMPEFVFEPQQIEDLLAYIASLAPKEPAPK